MIIYGGIPEHVTYIVKAARSVTRGWTGLDDLHLAAPVAATPAFAVDPASKTAMATARRWAGDGAPEVATTNDPIAAVEILTIEVRDEGGRAYKVRLDGVGDGSLYVDMREDVVLDALLVNGVKKGGRLKGPFVWGHLQSQLRLVRVGSTLHAAMVAAGARKAEPVVSPGSYVVGGVYLTRKLEALVYLGKCDADSIEFESVPATYGRGFVQGSRLVRITERAANLWFELKYHGGALGDVRRGDPALLASASFWAEVWEKVYDPAHVWIWGLRAIKKPAVTRRVTEVTVDWHALRRAAVRSALARPTHAIGMDHVARAEENLRFASRLAHARPAGAPLPEHPEYAALWARIK